MLPRHFAQTVMTNKLNRFLPCAVKQHIWRSLRLQLKVHRDAMPLIGAYTYATFIKSEALFIVTSHDFVKLLPRDKEVMFGARYQKRVDGHPATGSQCQTQTVRTMP